MTILYFILLIGVLIFVHELGHFLFAKLFNVKVLKFSLGFGPRMLGFRKGETEYVIAWLPLGGYVKMLGEDPNDEIREEDQGRAFHQKPLWQRYIIVFAGPAFNLIFPTLIYFVFYMAQTTLPPSVIGKVFVGQPAAEAGLEAGDTIVAINGERVRYWEDMQRIISDSPRKPLKFTIKREGKTFDRFITPSEEVRRDRLGLEQREGRIGIANYSEPVQVGVGLPSSPAGRAGLQTGDQLTALDGEPIVSWSSLRRKLQRSRGKSLRLSYLRPGKVISGFADLRLMAPRITIVDPEALMKKGRRRYETGLDSAEFFVAKVEKGSPAEKLGIKRGDRVLEFNGKKLHHWETIRMTLRSHLKAEHSITWIPYGSTAPKTAKFKLAHVTYYDEYKQKQERYVFGAHNRLIREFPPPVPIEGRFTYAVSQGIQRTGEIVGVIAIAFVQIFRGAIPRDTIGGPVMLYHTAGVAARKGWDHFLSMMALISINLGILNLLPIPILDGGHIMFFTIEAIKRRPLSLRAREIASYIGLFLLVSLMVFAFKNDIVRYWFK
ncbi:MAG: RIP metalloprotease RseP [Myxococcales bacterium]|nr:RIP metalloprotease RseP [Myxococcales bacterium]